MNAAQDWQRIRTAKAGEARWLDEFAENAEARGARRGGNVIGQLIYGRMCQHRELDRLLERSGDAEFIGKRQRRCFGINAASLPSGRHSACRRLTP